MGNSEHNFEEVGNDDPHDNHNLTENSFWSSKIKGCDFINEEWSDSHIVTHYNSLDDSKSK